VWHEGTPPGRRCAQLVAVYYLDYSATDFLVLDVAVITTLVGHQQQSCQHGGEENRYDPYHFAHQSSDFHLIRGPKMRS